MTLPLLDYPLSAQNQRVYGFEVLGEEQPRQDSRDIDAVIMAAYRQIFNEQQLTSSTRQPALESQLRCGQISVRDFVRELAISDVFRTRNYDTNNNYRFVQMCVQRILGREVYNDREKLAWSIVLATQGLHGFIDALVNTEEYLTHFGDSMVPYQRRRILPQRSSGELPFARMARYGADYRDRLPQPFDDQFAAFDLNRFMQQANWPVAIGLVLSLSVIVAFLLLLSVTLGAS
jgi:phycobilisome rod-core linker protein